MALRIRALEVRWGVNICGGCGGGGADWREWMYMHGRGIRRESCRRGGFWVVLWRVWGGCGR